MARCSKKCGDACHEPPLLSPPYLNPTTSSHASSFTIIHSPARHLFLSLFVTMQFFSSSLPFHFLFLLFMSILSFSSLFFLLLLFLQWRHPNHKRLPPGSMGWPYIGETLKLYTENPNLFFSIRQKRYINTDDGQL